MTINPNNFEAYLLDYLEGNLDPLLTAELMAFLAENPEFEKYIPDFEAMPIAASPITFQHKDLLKKDFADIKSISEQNFDEFCIAYYEGLLESADIERLNAYTGRHPDRKKVLESYQWMKLQPDLSVTYKDKSRLKKSGSSTLRYLYFGLAVAASLALLFWLTGNRQPSVSEQPGIISEQLREKISPELQIVVPEKPVAVKKATGLSTGRPRDTGSDLKTPSPIERETFMLSSLEPKSSSLEIPLHLPPVKSRISFNPAEETTQPGLFAELFNSDSFLRALVSRIDFWKTAESAIEGINYLTETQLSIDRTVDENGNLTSLLLKTESYTIEGNKAR